MIYPKDFEQKIDFNYIRDSLNNLCISEMGKENTNSLSCSSDIQIIDKSLRQIEEFWNLLEKGIPFPIRDYNDLRDVFKHLNIEGTVIDIDSLFALKPTLSALLYLLQFLQSEASTQYPHLKALAEGIIIDNHLFTEINRLIDDKGEIPDDASQELAEIRHDIRRKQSSIEHKMHRILIDAKTSGWTDSNAELTIRNGRLVIPVKAANKRALQGFIHDESSTGQTVYIEPAEIFDTNNEIRELEYAEKREVNKILTNFTKLLRPEIPNLVMAWNLLGQIDFIRAKAIMCQQYKCVIPEISDQPLCEWKQARHPLLEQKLKSQGKFIVPLDLKLDKNNRILVISGPNAGGKSVCLKTTGLIQYMFQCGLAVPMEIDSKCGIFNNLFINIGDEQSLEDDLSTYSSHLLNMKELLKNSDDHSLFLIDEFGTGTEPQLGGAIAEAILLKLNKKKVFGLVTTHYTNLKLLADDNPGIINGAMLFDTKYLQPLYIMMTGKPGSSFAFEIAKKIGFPQEILKEASEISGKEHLNFEQQLQQLEIEKKEIRKKEYELRLADNLLDEVVTKYKNLLAELEKKKNTLLKEANKEAQSLIDKANAKIENTIREIKEAQAEKERTKELRRDLKDMKQQLESDAKKIAESLKIEEKNKIDNSHLEVGDMVCINELEVIGELIAISDTDITISFESVKLRTTADKVRKISKKEARKAANNPAYLKKNIMDDINEKAENFKLTLDVRGKRGEEAIDAVAKYIDEAVLLSIHNINILHGKGNGILRNLIRQYLSTSPDVSTFHDASLETGGSGITEVSLK